MKSHSLPLSFVVLVFAFPSIASSIIINGDFSDPIPLAGFTATGTVISEPTEEFAQLETDGTFQRTLEQTFTIPSLPTFFSFDFAFSTEGAPPFAGFPDSFASSQLTTVDGDFLDILVVDANAGVVPDPSDGIEAITGAVPIDVMFDSSVTIASFTPFPGGTTFAGRISLWLPNAVLGEEATLFFDLFDESDGFQTIAAVDNIVAKPIPEPATVYLLLIGLLGFGWLVRRNRQMSK